MTQPVWDVIESLGDVDYREGGKWLHTDQTGVYDPEMEVYIPEQKYMYRFSIEKCTYLNGILSDNQFHPDHPVWWNPKEVANFIGVDIDNLIQDVCSDDIVKRAMIYIAIGEYYGYLNLDQYPLQISDNEAEERYTKPKYNVK